MYINHYSEIYVTKLSIGTSEEGTFIPSSQGHHIAQVKLIISKCILLKKKMKYFDKNKNKTYPYGQRKNQ